LAPKRMTTNRLRNLLHLPTSVKVHVSLPFGLTPASSQRRIEWLFSTPTRCELE
ncbi:hypothetical protein SK128_020958, partial [Halocaridina rubra]